MPRPAAAPAGRCENESCKHAHAQSPPRKPYRPPSVRMPSAPVRADTLLSFPDKFGPDFNDSDCTSAARASKFPYVDLVLRKLESGPAPTDRSVGPDAVRRRRLDGASAARYKRSHMAIERRGQRGSTAAPGAACPDVPDGRSVVPRSRLRRDLGQRRRARARHDQGRALPPLREQGSAALRDHDVRVGAGAGRGDRAGPRRCAIRKSACDS